MYAIGEIAFAFLNGCLIKFVPYWYLVVLAITINIIGYLIYLLTTVGWMILIARLLAGGFSGMSDTTVLTYFSEREQEYNQLQDSHNKLGSSDLKICRDGAKEMLFAFCQLVITVAFLFGTGVLNINIVMT